MARANGQRLGYDEEFGHRLAHLNPRISMVRHRCSIMSEYNTIRLRSPGQHHGIGGAPQPGILHAHNVQVGVVGHHAIQHIIVEVLIREQADHSASSCAEARRASKRSRMPNRTPTRINFLLHLFGPHGSRLQVGCNSGLMA